MSDVNDLHHKAMDLAELALIERLKGNSGESSTLFRKALEFELAAISELDGEIEPTFSVLHRSAGTMALHCGEIRLAEQIAAKALSCEPPEEIAEELRDVLEQVNFQRHLGLKGIDLAEDELQVSLSGQEESLEPAGEVIELRGMLRYADAAGGPGNRIRIIDDGGMRHTVEVPSGLINDIVRKMWNSYVMVRGLRRGPVVELQDIWPEPRE